MTRYQACRALGLDPICSAFVALLNAIGNVPEGVVAVLHMQIEYDPNIPYKRGMKINLDTDVK